MEEKTARLEGIRAILGLNKTDFAAIMGVTPHYYYNILSGKGSSNLRLEHLESLLKHHAVNPAWIMTGEGSIFLERTGAEQQPKVSAQMLKSIIADDFPKGWEKTWMRKIVDAVCDQVANGNQTGSILEMKNAVLTGVLALYAQVSALIEQSGTQAGDLITLNLEGEKFVFRHLGDDAQQ